MIANIDSPRSGFTERYEIPSGFNPFPCRLSEKKVFVNAGGMIAGNQQRGKCEAAVRQRRSDSWTATVDFLFMTPEAGFQIRAQCPEEVCLVTSC